MPSGASAAVIGARLYGNASQWVNPVMHALGFLKSQAPAIGPVVVLVGEERELKRQALARLARHVLGESDEGLGLTRFSGDEADLTSVCDELLTVAMWGERRLVVVDEADRFVAQHRAALEKYLQKPAKKSVLALDVASWPKTTRLARLVAKIGLAIECAPLSGAELARWLAETARSAHGKNLGRDAAALMVQLAGEDFGLLEQELAKLAAFVGARPAIEADDVRTLVGGWRTETTWAIAGAIRRGKAGEALDLLDNLLCAGESPHKVFGGLTFVFRRLAQAVALVREGRPLEAALRESGVFPRELGESSAYLRRLGRAEAAQIITRLLASDANLKGAITIAEQSILETLVVNLAQRSGLPRPG